MTTKDRIRVIRRVLHEHVVEDRGYETPCWIWTGSLGKGYGAIGVGGKAIGVPRALLASLNRLNLDAGRTQCALHKCDVRLCCRPSHLYNGTYKDNSRDCLDRSRLASTRGSSNPHTQMTEKEVSNIKQRLTNGEASHSILKDCPISKQGLSKIRTGRTWIHVK